MLGILNKLVVVATGDCLLLLEEGFGGAQAAWKGGAQAAWKGGAIINRCSPLQHFDFVASRSGMLAEWYRRRVRRNSRIWIVLRSLACARSWSRRSARHPSSACGGDTGAGTIFLN